MPPLRTKYKNSHLFCRGRRPRRPVYKGIIAFCTGSRGRLPLRVCAIFVILVVGATSGRPSFIKVSLRFERTCTWQAASLLRKHCARPYGFDCFPKINACREGYYPLLHYNPSVIFLRKCHLRQIIIISATPEKSIDNILTKV